MLRGGKIMSDVIDKANKVQIKIIKVTNKDNMLVQIPKWICDLWELENGDKLSMDMQVSALGKVLLISKCGGTNESSAPGN